MKRITKLAVLGLTALAITACEREKDEPKVGSLTHHLTLIGEDGRHYGRAELDPVGGGRIYDAQGTLIGLVQPVAPGTITP